MNDRKTIFSNAFGALAAATLLAAGGQAATAATTLDFEGATSFASIAEFYNGGTDGAGQSGSNQGASFGLDLLAFSNDATGPVFSHAPTPVTVLTAVGPDAFVNIAQGFAGAASFFYSATESVVGAVGVYSGLNGGGSLLGSFNLNANAQAGCSDTAYCNWEKTSIRFAGIGQSFGFAGSVGKAAFDDLSFTAAATPVPEPSSYALMALGLAAIGVVARRTKR